MKKIGLYITMGLAMGAAGCNKYLDKDPDNRAQLNSPEKVAQLVATAYPNTNYWAFAECSSDNVGDRGSGTTEYEIQDPYMFRDVRSNQPDSPEGYWGACYKAVAAANEALQAISQTPDSVKYNAQKGEALVARAYAHFMLVNFFSKFYNKTTAASDAGIPYVTEPENVVVKQYERKTVQYVYDMVEKDLQAGLPLIRDEKYSVPAYHFTRVAAHAFAVRYYLFKQQYDSVLVHSAEIFTSSDISPKLRQWNTTYKNMTRLELMATYQKATEPANLLLCETYSSYARSYLYGRYAFDPGHSQTLIFGGVPALSQGDWSFGYQAYGGDNVVYMPKVNEYFVRLSVNADIGDPYVMVPLFTAEEVLFSRAEAMVSKSNYTGALELLNAYLSTRIYNYDASIHTLTTDDVTSYYGLAVQAAFNQLILDYKRAEFIHEGQRWFDILRKNLPVTHTIYGTGATLTLAADSKQKVFQIPQSAVLSGLALNPR
ncbi:RagB/SusD family nutrient uptake outer membrane protein [Filimonas lacunae]|nr:RagB/SusD family nutrient uptake outer membrane protein [Filimonas lacunae]